LAQRLGVRAPSLYHHFADKNEILWAVGRHIAGKSVTRPRRAPGDDWPEYFVDLALNFRQSVLRHRKAAPILLKYLPREILVNGYEDAARFLTDSGVPAHLHLRILDGVEMLSVGAVLIEAVREPRRYAAVFPGVDIRLQPHLAEALATNEMTVKALYAERIRSYLHGLIGNAAASEGATRHESSA
jgi:AcrR family transcriptional regulator